MVSTLLLSQVPCRGTTHDGPICNILQALRRCRTPSHGPAFTFLIQFLRHLRNQSTLGNPLQERQV